ncbi:MAG: hypothetical protein ACXAC7_22170 [Candidatus Hodarchaeales archaeon]|jgi:hypothetical protein
MGGSLYPTSLSSETLIPEFVALKRPILFKISLIYTWITYSLIFFPGLIAFIQILFFELFFYQNVGGRYFYSYLVFVLLYIVFFGYGIESIRLTLQRVGSTKLLNILGVTIILNLTGFFLLIEFNLMVIIISMILVYFPVIFQLFLLNFHQDTKQIIRSSKSNSFSDVWNEVIKMNERITLLERELALLKSKK